ncbi:MAG: hypothetical protein KC587_12695, partial [Nitrospira sp.]|nr:hypothetical protein [Nitrospira sp.]
FYRMAEPKNVGYGSCGAGCVRESIQKTYVGPGIFDEMVRIDESSRAGLASMRCGLSSSIGYGTLHCP